MPNAINSNGLTIQTRAEIVAELLDGVPGFRGYRAIYGADINVDPNSADGQLINLIAQAKVDILEFIQQIYDGFDPDMAIGRTLDERCAINGVVRKAGTYTIQPVTVTVTQALTLAGLDTAPDAPFTVADSAGNRFVLEEAHVFSGAGNASLTFRAALLGATVTTPNTITRPITIQLGVASVNNPLAATSIGTDEETDYALRIRRAQSVSIPSRGYFEGLVGALLSLDSVTSVLVKENDTDTPDGDGIPGHSIWVVVNGGTDDEVAAVIYNKRNAGCGMKGDVTVNITQVDGSLFPINFDRPTPQTLWIKFDITAITGSFDPAYLRAQILTAIRYQIGQPAAASTITAFLQELMPNCYITGSTIGPDGVSFNYTQFLQTTTPAHQWALASARIIINGSAG